MSTKLRSLLLGFACTGALALAAPANATVHVTNVQVPYSESVTLHDGIFGAGNSDGIGIAGQIVLTTNIGTLGTWCVDLFHVVYLGGTYDYEPGPLLTDNTGNSPATSNPLSLTQIDEIEALAPYGNGMMKTSPSNPESAAIQSAIWDVEYGTTATGSAAMESDLATIEALLPHLPVDGGYQLYNQNAQGLFNSQGLFVSTPEPASLALIGGGLAGLAIGRRKRTSKI